MGEIVTTVLPVSAVVSAGAGFVVSPPESIENALRSELSPFVFHTYSAGAPSGTLMCILQDHPQPTGRISKVKVLLDVEYTGTEDDYECTLALHLGGDTDSAIFVVTAAATISVELSGAYNFRDLEQSYIEITCTGDVSGDAMSATYLRAEVTADPGPMNFKNILRVKPEIPVPI